MLFGVYQIYAIDSACVKTDIMDVYKCPESSQDWYSSYEDLVDTLELAGVEHNADFTHRYVTASTGTFTSSCTASGFFGNGEGITGIPHLISSQTYSGQNLFVSSVSVQGQVIKVSTSANSSDSLCLLGAVDVLPLSGYDRGCMAFHLGDVTLYVSTETVASSDSWKSAW